MAAENAAETTTPASTFHVVVLKDFFRGYFEVSIEETVRVFKERVAAYLNTIRDDPSLRIPYQATEENPHPEFPYVITPDDFQLRRRDIADVVLEDTALIGDHLAYKYITPEVVLLMINKNGVVSPIEIPESAPSRDAPAEERNALKEKCAEKIQAEYEALLKKE